MVLLLTVESSSAHTELISSNPMANSTVQVAPASISLKFSEAPLLVGTHLDVQQPLGLSISSVTPTLIGTTISTPWPTTTKPGTVFIVWRAVADDGHISTGKFQFNYIKASASASTTTVANDSNQNRKYVAFALIGLLLLNAIFLFNKRKTFRN